MPLTKKLFVTETCWERDNEFSPMEVTGYKSINHPGQVPCTGEAKQHRMDSVGFVSVLLCFGFGFYFVFDFHCFLFEREIKT